MSILSKKNFVSVKHTYFETEGAPEAEMVGFLKGRAASILYIRHPFPDAKQIPLNTTLVEYGPDGGVVRERTAPAVRGHALFFYLKDLVFSICYVLGSGKKYDLYAGSDNLNALAGIILRALGRVRRVAYYVIDFTPVRFPGRVMNGIYQAINKFCCYHADIVWNVSPSMIEGRERIGILPEKSAPQLTVPLGCDFARISKTVPEKHDPYTLAYFGMLREEHGPGLILEALPSVMKEFPQASVVFAGDGELRDRLERRAAEMGISDRVRFTGFVGSDREAYRVLGGCGLALATYPPDDNTYKRYCDPGKVKIYLACGLPTLITDVPAVAGEIQKRGAGRIVEYSPDSLAGEIIDIFRNPEEYALMRERAVALAAEYSWDSIWKRTFSEMDTLFPEP